VYHERREWDLDLDLAYSPADLGGINALVEEMAEQFSPGGLFLVGRVPDPGAAGEVIAAVGHGRVGHRRHRASGWTLMPEGS
jgi:hypothetical protein